jgi:hypothetical protein
MTSAYQPPALVEIGTLHDLTLVHVTIHKTGPVFDILDGVSVTIGSDSVSIGGPGFGSTLSVIVTP